MKTPAELIEAVTRLNESLQRGEVKDLEMATLIARGHQTVAKSHGNQLTALKLAAKFGMNGGASLREMLTEPTEAPAQISAGIDAPEEKQSA